MPSKFPAALDSLATASEDRTESVSGKAQSGEPEGAGFHAGLHNDANDAINKMQAELGTDPSAGYSTVGARITADEIFIAALESSLAGKQPLDADLTAIAALSTTSFGRGLLALANASALREAAEAQPLDSDLTAIAALSTTSFGRSLLTQASAAAALTTLGAEAAANKDTDAALAANSDVKYASQKAVKAYVDGLLAASDAVVYKGVKDCSASPNYPAADAGHLYVVSVAGKIGGASGGEVEAGDMFICKADGTASGTQAAVGANWNVIQSNLVGAVTGPASSVSGQLASFEGTTGKIIKDSGKVVTTSTALAGNSDSNIPTEKAVKAYVDNADKFTTFEQMLTRPEGRRLESFPRILGELKNASVLTSGTLYLFSIILPGGLEWKEFDFHSATQAAVEPKNQWICLCDSSRKFLAKSADKTTEAWGANARKTFALSEGITPAETALHYVGLLVKATTVPTLQAKESINSFPLNLAPILAGNSNTGLEGPGGITVGNTATTLTGTPKPAYITAV